jgi:hypothetical protein
LLIPVAIEVPQDANLLNSLGKLAEGRGTYAHKGRVTTVLVPEDAKLFVEDVLILCDDVRAKALVKLSTVSDLENLALDLPEKDRATLAANLLESLPGVLSDEDEGVAEALRRDAEIEADPAQAISLAELDSQIQGRRG